MVSIGTVELCEDLLKNGMPVEIEVLGHSMYPTICHGDSIIVHPLPETGFKSGNILLFRNGQRLTAHRLVRKSSGTLVLRGDALQVCESVEPNQILGKVVTIVRECRSYKVDSLSMNARFFLRRFALFFRSHVTAAR